MNHQNDFTTEEKYQFFYNLDKICIIEEILKGNAQKYGLKVVYPEDWFTKETTDNIEVASDDNAVIPQNCTEAIVKVINPTFTLTNKAVMNSRKQIVKAASVINLTANVQVAMLMAISIDVEAIRSGTKCIDFIRALIGIGVLKYSDDKAIENMSDGMNKKLRTWERNKEHVSSNLPDYLLWKNKKDKKIGEKIYKAMTTEEL